MKKLSDYTELLNEEDVKQILIDLIYSNNLISYVDKIIFSNNIEFARYCLKSKILYFNLNNILHYIILKSKKNKITNNTELVNYLNCNILIILYHEIVHVIQRKNYNEIIFYSELYEQQLKLKNKYNINKYLSNPIERQAFIKSLVYVLLITKDNTNKTNIILKNELINRINYGYYSEKKFPIKSFFENSLYYESISKLSNIGDMNLDEKLEYGLKLDDTELIKIRR